MFFKKIVRMSDVLQINVKSGSEDQIRNIGRYFLNQGKFSEQL